MNQLQFEVNGGTGSSTTPASWFTVDCLVICSPYSLRWLTIALCERTSLWYWHLTSILSYLIWPQPSSSCEWISQTVSLMKVYIHTKSHRNCTAVVAFRDPHHPLIWSIKKLSILSGQPTQFAPGGGGGGRALTLIEPLCQRRLSSHNCTGRLLGSRVQQFRERACEQSRRSSPSDRLRAQKWCNSCWAGRFTAEARLKYEDRSVDFAPLPLPHAVWPPGGLNLEVRGLSQLVPPYKGPFCCLHQLFHEFIYNVNTCFPSKRYYLGAFSRNRNSDPCLKCNLSNLIGFRHPL